LRDLVGWSLGRDKGIGNPVAEAIAIAVDEGAARANAVALVREGATASPVPDPRKPSTNDYESRKEAREESTSGYHHVTMLNDGADPARSSGIGSKRTRMLLIIPGRAQGATWLLLSIRADVR